MAGQNSLILATDYNSIQSKVALVLGTGLETTGYGQTVLSSQVPIRSNITVAQWSNLKTDLLKARQHQTGSDLNSALTLPTKLINITDADRLAYAQMADEITLASNRLIKPPINQATREALVPVQQRTSPWNGTLTHTITITFPNVDAARYFFNSGSQIEFSAERFGGTNNSKNNTWTSMFSSPPSSGMGVIAFNYNSTTNTGTGVASTSIGWYQLLAEDQLIFQKNAPTGDYADNKYFIFAKRPQPNVLVFTIRFSDQSVQLIDEDVDGTLNSIVQVYRASGNNVSVPAPAASTSGIGGGLAPIISISPVTISDMQVGTPNSTTFITTGGASPYIYNYTGTIPAGLTLSQLGVLSGTPNTAATYTFYISSTDSNNFTASRTYTVKSEIRTITISPTTLPNLPIISKAFSTTISAAGGVTPYVFSVPTGLPPGLTISTTGVISGTPTTADSYTFTVTATDAELYTASRTYTVIVPPLLSAVTPTTFSATEANPLSVTFGATGGIGPYTFSPTGVWPTGANFSSLAGVSTVTLSGTPSAVSTGTFQLNVTDTTGQTVLGAVTWTVAARPALTLAFVTQTSYQVGVAVNPGTNVTATGGTAPYTYTVLSGTLPGGVSLLANGNFTGIPTTSGSVNFTVRAIDSTGLAGSASTSLTIAAPPPPPAIPTITLSPATSSQTISRTTAAQTTTGSFTVNCTAGSGVVTVANGIKPAGSTTAFAPNSFFITSGSSQIIDFTATSAISSSVSDSFTYVFQAAIAGGATGLSHTHTQARVALPVSPPETPISTGTLTISPTSSQQTWIVPSRVTSVNLILIGAGGGGGGNDRLGGADGYPGDQFNGPLSVTPGDVLTFSVGARGRRGMPSTGQGAGAGGTVQSIGAGAGGRGGAAGSIGSSGGGGGGGGATSLKLNSTLIAVACGGGGGGGGGDNSSGQYLSAESYTTTPDGTNGQDKDSNTVEIINPPTTVFDINSSANSDNVAVVEYTSLPPMIAPPTLGQADGLGSKVLVFGSGVSPGGAQIRTATTLATVNLSQRTTLRFYVNRGTLDDWGQPPDTGEELKLEYSSDGSTWATIVAIPITVQSNRWLLQSVTIPNGAKVSGTVLLRLRQTTNGAVVSFPRDTWAITSIQATGGLTTTYSSVDGGGGGGGGGGIYGGLGGQTRTGDNGAFCGSRGLSSTVPAGWNKSVPSTGNQGAATGGNGGLGGIAGSREPTDGGDGSLTITW